MRKLFKAVFVCIFALAGGTVIAGDWKEYRSDSLRLYTDLPEPRARVLVQDLELFRVSFDEYFGHESEPPPLPLEYYVFSTRADFRRFSDEWHASGIYMSTHSGPVAAAIGQEQIDKRKMDGRSFVLHEYLHYLLDQKEHRSLPRWYVEGLADYLSTMRFGRSQTVVGEPLLGRVETLKDRSGWLPLEEIFAADSLPDISEDTEEHMQFFYAQAWLVVHVLHQNPKYAGKLDAFLDYLAEGHTARQAFREIYDRSLARVRRDAVVHLAAIRSRYATLNRSRPYAPVVTARKLDDREEALLPWKAELALITNGSNARSFAQRLDAAAGTGALSKRDARPLQIQAHIEARNLKRAYELLDQVAPWRAERSPYRELVLEADLMQQILDNLTDNSGYDREKMQEIRTSLATLVGKYPENPRLHYLYGLADLVDEATPVQPEGVAALRRARTMMPGNSEVAFLFASSLAETGDHAAACPVLQELKQKGGNEILRRHVAIRLDDFSRAGHPCPAG